MNDQIQHVRPGDIITADLINHILDELEALRAAVEDLQNQTPPTPTRPTFTFTFPTATLTQPTLTFTFPTATLTQPTLTFTFPTGTLTQPTLTFTFPTGTLTQPTLTFTFPTATLTQPTLTFSFPTGMLTQPTGNLTVAPTFTVEFPTGISSFPTASFSPTSRNNILNDTTPVESARGDEPVTRVRGIGSNRARALADANIDTLDALADADTEEVASVMGVSVDRASDFIAEARNLLGRR